MAYWELQQYTYETTEQPIVLTLNYGTWNALVNFTKNLFFLNKHSFSEHSIYLLNSTLKINTISIRQNITNNTLVDLN